MQETRVELSRSVAGINTRDGVAYLLDKPIFFTLLGLIVLIAINLERIDATQKRELVVALTRVRENIYFVERAYNPFFWLGKIYYGLDLYDNSLEALHQSIKLCGDDDQALYYIAACHEVKSDHEAALNYYKKALALDPSCTTTRDAITRMEDKLAMHVA